MSLTERPGGLAIRGGLPAVRIEEIEGPVIGQLPANLRESDLFLRFMAIFERLYDTLAVHADGLEHLADPTVAPPRMIDVWMKCLQLDRLEQAQPLLPLARRRSTLAALGPIIRRRGTCRGLRELLNLLLFGTPDVAGQGVTVSDNGGVTEAGQRTRAAGERPEVMVQLPHTVHFALEELVLVIRHEVPVHVHIVVTVVRPSGAVEEIYRGPATGPVLTEGFRP
jgi:phage tail-like protein